MIHKSKSPRTIAVAGVTLLMVLAQGTASLGATSAPRDADALVIDGITTDSPVTNRAELDAFLASSEPKVVTFGDDGAVVSVMLDHETPAVEPAEALAPKADVQALATSTRSPCAATDFCLGRPAPYNSTGFYGAGSRTGSWTYVTSIGTHSWSGQFYIGGSTLCSPQGWYGPNSRFVFPGSGYSICKVEVGITT